MSQKTADIKRVFDSYGNELMSVEGKLKSLFDSEIEVIPLVGRYLLKSGGKRMRPLYLLASARFAGYKGDWHIALAGIIEQIHMASLLHDDVVDGAQTRRGRPAAHAVWGNQVVILVGDFLYATALKTAVSFGNREIMESLSDATTRMTEGEIMQLGKSGDINISEDEYMKIITAKTGVLISSACRIGALLGGLGKAEEDALGRFGMFSGSAFQVADDVLDYVADEGDLGKRLGKDLAEGKITLPLICLLESASEAEKNELAEMLKSDVTAESLDRVLSLLKKYNAVEESLKRASSLVEDAKSALSIFPDSPAKEDLFDIADYALSRRS